MEFSFTSITDPLARFCQRIISGPGFRDIDDFDTWGCFPSLEFGYSVKLPLLPREYKVDLAQNSPYRCMRAWMLGSDPKRMFAIVGLELAEGGATDYAIGYAATLFIDQYFDRHGLLTSRQSLIRGGYQCNDATLQIRKSIFRNYSPAKVCAFGSGNRIFVLRYEAADSSERELMIANYFLDSFEFTEGYIEPARPPGVGPIIQSVEAGSVDLATGWRKFGPIHGVRFLLPGEATATAQLREKPEHVSPYFAYQSGDGKHYFCVEIFDEIDPAQRDSPRQLADAIDEAFRALAVRFEAEGMMLVSAKNVWLNGLSGREWEVVVIGKISAGRLQIFATPTRTYLFTGMCYLENTDQQPLDQFFSNLSIAIDQT